MGRTCSTGCAMSGARRTCPRPATHAIHSVAWSIPVRHTAPAILGGSTNLPRSLGYSMAHRPCPMHVYPSFFLAICLPNRHSRQHPRRPFALAHSACRRHRALTTTSVSATTNKHRPAKHSRHTSTNLPNYNKGVDPASDYPTRRISSGGGPCACPLSRPVTNHTAHQLHPGA
ncbi:hypothetical protein AG1IA_04004 [Rhizoctonia solani AG-1 IA]|uniref:Uncharacterized protein n=1 Tax=Thanatephorus cucumeris (strain AG1-IA) TaxID=983506 RepID=L8WV06_THACA|nr:hypothetical protein AG1IA_04004 [Rhizoctonia solani AG-1 IA]